MASKIPWSFLASAVVAPIAGYVLWRGYTKVAEAADAVRDTAEQARDTLSDPLGLQPDRLWTATGMGMAATVSASSRSEAIRELALLWGVSTAELREAIDEGLVGLSSSDGG